MCLYDPKPLKQQTRVGYKVVMIVRRSKKLCVTSPMMREYRWKPNMTNIAHGRLIICPAPKKWSSSTLSEGVLHCWKNRTDAFQYLHKEYSPLFYKSKNRGINFSFGVIKVKLSGELFEGNDFATFSNRQVAGSKAYWDGKIIEST